MSLLFFWVTGQWMEEVLQWAWTISWDSHLWFWWAIYFIEVVWLEFYSSQKQVSLFLKTSLFGTKNWSQYVGTKNCKFLNGHLRSCSTEQLKMTNKTNKQKCLQLCKKNTEFPVFTFTTAGWCGYIVKCLIRGLVTLNDRCPCS